MTDPGKKIVIEMDVFMDELPKKGDFVILMGSKEGFSRRLAVKESPYLLVDVVLLCCFLDL